MSQRQGDQAQLVAAAEAIQERVGCKPRTALWWAARRTREGVEAIEVTLRPHRRPLVERRLVKEVE